MSTKEKNSPRIAYFESPNFMFRLFDVQMIQRIQRREDNGQFTDDVDYEVYLGNSYTRITLNQEEGEALSGLLKAYLEGF